MEIEALKELWKQEEARSFMGWDFSSLNGILIEEDLPWDYKHIIEQYIKEDMTLLDMGTGGGEFLLQLNHPYELTTVSESYPPNIQLCQEKLMPLGITVYPSEMDSPLQLEAATYDIIINRHEYFEASNVYRLLKPGGLFITQQVGAYNNAELSKLLVGDGRTFHVKDTLDYQLKEMEECGFKIIKSQEHYPIQRFKDVGALVYFAKIIEWEFPGFTVDRNFDTLLEIHQHIQSEGDFGVKEHRYLLVGRK